MLDINLIRKNPDLIRQEIKKRNIKMDVDEILKLDKKRRGLLTKIEKLRAKQNKISNEVARLSGKEKQKAILEGKALSEHIKQHEPKLKKLEEKFHTLMLELPNLAQEDVPIGKDETENVVIKKWGKIPKFSFKVKDYLELGDNLDLIDCKRAAKVSGSRFGYLRNEVVLLEFALIQFGLDMLVKEGFIPIVPPVLINKKAMEGMGYLTHGAEEIYYFPKDKLYLVGTAEQSIGPMYINEVLSEKELPKRYVGFSNCFRREAGAYGKDVKGILRVHQFDKLEMFSFCLPNESKKEHKFLLNLEEKLVQALNMPYQVVQMCTGDLGDPAAAKYDIECWMSGQEKYRETHSTSNCTDFQARRLNIRYKGKDGKLYFMHTLNGTAFAIGRILIAILENYQQKDGSVLVPKVLQKYCGFEKIRRK